MGCSEYEDLVDVFISKMMGIKGTTIQEYIAGLHYALDEIEVSLQAAKEDLK